MENRKEKDEYLLKLTHEQADWLQEKLDFFLDENKEESWYDYIIRTSIRRMIER